MQQNGYYDFTTVMTCLGLLLLTVTHCTGHCDADDHRASNRGGRYQVFAMPTFGGKLLEEGLNSIRIDNFGEENYDGQFFFLTHYRIDQVKGLYGFDFAEVLINNEEKLLCCSPDTKRFLLNNQKCRIPKTRIVEMALNITYIFYPHNQPYIKVTLIAARHCPGSVMIYMVQAGRRVLYTGDFRVTAFTLNKYRVFKNWFGAVVPLHTLYLDITFCDPKWLTFPDSITTNDDILAIILYWILEDPNHEIGLLYDSHHGLESLLLQVVQHKLIKTKIWIIDQEAYANYACITRLQDFICKEKEGSRIHICPVNTVGNCVVCQWNRANTVTIQPVAMTYEEQWLNKSGNGNEGSNLVKVPYSRHCSLGELNDICQFFNPEKVVPCVTRRGLTDKQLDCKLTFSDHVTHDIQYALVRLGLYRFRTLLPESAKLQIMQVLQDLQNLQLGAQKYLDQMKEENNQPGIPPSMRHSFYVAQNCAGASSLVLDRSQISSGMDIVRKKYIKRKPQYFSL